jgi:hypothetical protein
LIFAFYTKGQNPLSKRQALDRERYWENGVVLLLLLLLLHRNITREKKTVEKLFFLLHVLN